MCLNYRFLLPVLFHINFFYCLLVVYYFRLLTSEIIDRETNVINHKRPRNFLFIYFKDFRRECWSMLCWVYCVIFIVDKLLFVCLDRYLKSLTSDVINCPAEDTVVTLKSQVTIIMTMTLILIRIPRTNMNRTTTIKKK